MGNLNFTYSSASKELEAPPFFYLGALEKKGIAEKKCLNSSTYGFNGMERDDELNGVGNSYNTHFRQYDPRIARWFSLDPKMKKFTSFSPYNFSLNTPTILNDPRGDDPITAVLDATVAFGLEAGLDFLTMYLLEDKSVEEAFDNISWGAASYEAGKAYVLSSFSLPGTVTATKIYKVSKTRIGKVTTAIVVGMAEEIGKKYEKGDYNDENGEFDFDLVNFEEVFWTSVLNTLVEQGFEGKIDEIIDNLDEATKDVLKQKGLLAELENGTRTRATVDPNAAQARINKGNKTIKKETAKKVVVKGAEESTKKTVEAGANEVKIQSEEPKSSVSEYKIKKS
ncbi:MAG: RHS repeat domain-containing protein [Bacteroidia bacterium]